MTEAIDLARTLIACPSVTPVDAGALDVVEKALIPLGFVCRRLPFGEGAERVDNLYARLGTGRPFFLFAGHTDVVPPGDGWQTDPFEPVIRDGMLIGRGAADMKGAIAAFIAAVAVFSRETPGFAGSIGLLLTGDEEGVARHGTKPAMEWMLAEGEIADACLVGEPTNPAAIGEMAKIGRRGSLNGVLTVRGRQGHVAYPHRADNPLPRLARMVVALTDTPIDEGSAHFEPSMLQITSIDTGNPAENVIPARARIMFNVRFNDLHTAADIEALVRARLDTISGDYDLSVRVSGESFLSPPGRLSDILIAAVAEETGRRPELSTSGGTSDARFLKDLCPVIEFGLAGQTMHQANECVAVEDIAALSRIYAGVLRRFFETS